MTVKTDVEVTQIYRILRFTLPIWSVLIILAVWGGFVHLDASSLWLDELFTVYLSDPAQPTFSAFLSRASEDVHPPGYYALVWAAAQLMGGKLPDIARGISAASGALSIVLIYFSMPSWVSRPARLFSCSVAANSIVYFVYTQEARSYALSWVLTALLVIVASSIIHAAARRNSLSWLLLLFVIVGIIASLIHLYLITIVGAMVIIMLYFGGNLGNRISIAISGSAVLAATLVFLEWHAGRIVADISDTWFQSDFDFLWQHTRIGIGALIGSTLEESLATILLAASLVAAAWMWTKRYAIENLEQAFVDITLLLGSAVVGIAIAILVTIFYTPSYSYRYFLVLAPFYWIAMGLLFELVLRSSLRWLIIGIVLFSTMTFGFLSVRLVWRDVPTKQPWRETAEFVETIQECRDAILPVVTLPDAYITGSEPANFYGYYLRNGHTRNWLSYSANHVTTFPGTGPAKDIVAQRVMGIDPCPILLWNVNHSNLTSLETARTSLLQNFDLPEDKTIILKTITLPESNIYMRLLGMSLQEGGHFLLIQG